MRRRTGGEAAPAPGGKGAKRGRTAALDLGAARVGVAVDDDLGLLAHPRGTLDARNRRKLLAALVALADEEKLRRFVIGLPLDMRGGEGDAARGARALAQEIANACGCDVVLWDERLTTTQARRTLADNDVHGRRAKARIDEAAAVVILQSWLDAQGRGTVGGDGSGGGGRGGAP